MKFTVIVLVLAFSAANAIIPPPAGKPVGVKMGEAWAKDLTERVSIVIKKLEEAEKEVQWVNDAKTDMKDLKGTFNSWFQSASKTINKARLNVDLLKLRDIVKPDNKTLLKYREESFGEICDIWSKAGVIKVEYQRWVGEENGPLNHLAFCIPSE
ncbi:uncharacterized protein LOC141852667 [Brevipalpus obovatus]|uniref:uncharacterized protein LOC141852667 n=1 Tax=Brevipalpus obovatus TaxID=246614 RepID=UPI003D9ED14A